LDGGKYITRAIFRGGPRKSRVVGALKWYEHSEVHNVWNRAMPNIMHLFAPPPPHPPPPTGA